MSDVLRALGYPGRGCVATRTQDGILHFAYFLTGRSLASRARELVVLDTGDVLVADISHSAHDQLRHYTAVARREEWLVLGNGDQVTPVADALARGTPPLQAARAHTYEPDPPIFTSRIWVAHSTATTEDCLISYARRSARGDDSTDRGILAIETLATGTGILMTTYDGYATNVHATGHPVDIAVTAHSGGQLLADIWAALDPQLRVAALVLRPDDTNTDSLLTKP